MFLNETLIKPTHYLDVIFEDVVEIDEERGIECNVNSCRFVLEMCIGGRRHNDTLREEGTECMALCVWSIKRIAATDRFPEACVVELAVVRSDVKWDLAAIQQVCDDLPNFPDVVCGWAFRLLWMVK